VCPAALPAPDGRSADQPRIARAFVALVPDDTKLPRAGADGIEAVDDTGCRVAVI